MCSQCGASNPGTALWCNQCYTQFDAGSRPGAAGQTTTIEPPTPPPAGVPDVAPTKAPHEDGVAPPAIAPSGGADAVQPDGDPGWICKTCESINPLTVDQCPVCGTTIYQNYGAVADERPTVDTESALRWGLIPGAGHAKAGHGLLGLTVGFLVVMTLLLSFMLVSGSQVGLGLGIGVVAVGLWAVSVYDATRLSAGADDGILLKPRVITVVAGLIVVVIIVIVMTRGIGPSV